MLFGEMLDEERRQGQIDVLLKLLREHKIDVRTAASMMGMNEVEFVKTIKNIRESEVKI